MWSSFNIYCFITDIWRKWGQQCSSYAAGGQFFHKWIMTDCRSSAIWLGICNIAFYVSELLGHYLQTHWLRPFQTMLLSSLLYTWKDYKCSLIENNTSDECTQEQREQNKHCVFIERVRGGAKLHAGGAPIRRRSWQTHCTGRRCPRPLSLPPSSHPDLSLSYPTFPLSQRQKTRSKRQCVICLLVRALTGVSWMKITWWQRRNL